MHEEFIKYLKNYKANEIIIQEGGDDTEFYCLLQGKVTVWKGDPKDRDNMCKVGEMKEKGTYFGEMSSLIEEPRSASVIAVEDCKVFKFPGSMLTQMILKQPKLALKLCTAMANRLRGTTGNQQNLTVQRNEIRDDATQQFLEAKENFQRLFIMTSAVESQLRNPLTKALVEYMGSNKLLKGGRRIHIDKEYLEEMPESIATLVEKTYANMFS